MPTVRQVGGCVCVPKPPALSGMLPLVLPLWRAGPSADSPGPGPLIADRLTANTQHLATAQCGWDSRGRGMALDGLVTAC